MRSAARSVMPTASAVSRVGMSGFRATVSSTWVWCQRGGSPHSAVATLPFRWATYAGTTSKSPTNPSL